MDEHWCQHFVDQSLFAVAELVRRTAFLAAVPVGKRRSLTSDPVAPELAQQIAPSDFLKTTLAAS